VHQSLIKTPVEEEKEGYKLNFKKESVSGLGPLGGGGPTTTSTDTDQETLAKDSSNRFK